MPTKKSPSQSLTVTENIENHIWIVRGEKVMLDSNLAELYGVTTKRLNEQVKRNLKRFPDRFMFRLTWAEANDLLHSRSQIATLKKGQNIKYAPYAFTEHGAVMLATVLNSPTAIQASIYIVEAFIRMRTILSAHKELARKLEEHVKKTDNRFAAVYEVIYKFLKPTTRKKPNNIGFRTK